MAACATRQALTPLSSVPCAVLEVLAAPQPGFARSKTFKLDFNAFANEPANLIRVIVFYFFRDHLVMQCKPQKEGRSGR